MNSKIIAIIYAIAAAAFYALNVPCSKILLSELSPVFLAGLLYLGAGFGVGIMYLFHFRKEEKSERLNKSDLPYTVGMVLLDIIAPILLMLGVKYGTSGNASLLGNFEIVATTLIAMLIFNEKVTWRLWTAILLITASSIILTFEIWLFPLSPVKQSLFLNTFLLPCFWALLLTALVFLLTSAHRRSWELQRQVPTIQLLHSLVYF